MINHIAAEELRRTTISEGLVLQGCGGDPQEWLDGMNDVLSEAGILLNGSKFDGVSVFDHNGLTNILFAFDGMTPERLDVGKLAKWRIAGHGIFGGAWLSDYRVKQLGASNDAPEEEAPAIAAFGERPSPCRDGYYSDGPQEDDPINGAPYFPISVAVGNGEHPEFGGFTMPLPATREALRPFLCGLEATSEAQIAVTGATSHIDGLADAITSSIGENPRLDELNYLAAKLQGMRDIEREAFAAAIAAERHTGSAAEIINITENLRVFDLQPAFSPKQYGEFLLETGMGEHANAFERAQENDSGFARYIEMLEDSFDAEACGRKTAAHENGAFTKLGYLTEQGEFQQIYRGPQDIPAEYRVFEPPAALSGMALDTFLLKLHALAGDEAHDAKALAAVANGLRADDFLVGLNAVYMGKAACPAEGFLRIAQCAAKEMLARGDAKVYRLMPDGPSCLSRLSVVHNGLNFAEHREFAIRRVDMGGLDKWAGRAAAEAQRQRERGEHKKTQGEEL